MPVYRFDTWKHSPVFGLDNYWHNTWYLDTPRVISDTYIDMPDLIRNESVLHYSHVRYSHVTVVNPFDKTDYAVWAANNWDPFHPEWPGQGAITANPAPFEYVKRIRKYPLMGRSGFMWFRGALSNDEIYAPGPHSHAGTGNRTYWQNILDNLIPLFASQGITVMIGYGANRNGSPTSFAPVVALKYEGVTIAKASKRAQAKVTGSGIAIYEAMSPNLVEFRDWVFNVGTWWNTGSNNVPDDVRTGSITLLGKLKSFLTTIKNYCDDVNGGEGGSVKPASFRWDPDSVTLGNFCDSTTSSLADDIDTINRIVPNEGPPGVFTITHANTDTILNITLKALAVYSEISYADYRNAANNASPGAP